jgi:hypothetical protein
VPIFARAFVAISARPVIIAIRHCGHPAVWNSGGSWTVPRNQFAPKKKAKPKSTLKLVAAAGYPMAGLKDQPRAPSAIARQKCSVSPAGGWP